MTLTDVAGSTVMPGKSDGSGREVFPPELIDLLMDRVKTDGIQMLGEGGLISELSKRIFERALDEELTEELGYERGDPAGRGSGNSRNGTTPKTVFTEVGSVDLDTPGTVTGPSNRGSSLKASPGWPGSTRTSSPCTRPGCQPGTSAKP